MREETLTFTLDCIAEKKFFTRYHSQNITKNPQSSSEYPYSLPFVRLHYWHLSVNFMSAFFGLERVWKRGNANDVSYGFDAIFSSYWRAVARSEESMLFVFLFPLSHEKKIQMSTHPVKKNELQSHQVFSEKLWTPISLDHSQVCVFKSVIASNRAHSALLDSIIWDWDITTYNANGKI